MRPERSKEATRILETVRRRRDCGRVHAAILELEPGETPDADAIMVAAKLHPVADVELTRAEALIAATEILTRDLSFRATIMPRAEAASLASAFLACFPNTARFWTNGELLLAQADGQSGAWASASKATFDAGIVVVSDTHAGLLWVEDED